MLKNCLEIKIFQFENLEKVKPTEKRININMDDDQANTKLEVHFIKVSSAPVTVDHLLVLLLPQSLSPTFRITTKVCKQTIQKLLLNPRKAWPKS